LAWADHGDGVRVLFLPCWAKRAELQQRGEPIDVTPAASKPKKGLRPVLIDDSKNEGELP